MTWAISTGCCTPCGRWRASSCTGETSASDYPRYTAASAVAETAERLTPIEQEPSLRLFQLTLGALRALSTAEHASTLVLGRAFLLRAMSQARVGPRRWPNAPCGTPRPACPFSVPTGGVVLPRLPATRCQSRPAPTTIELMIALTPETGGSPTPARGSIAGRCSGLVAAHLQWHLERGLRSLPLVDRSSGRGHRQRGGGRIEVVHTHQP